MAYIPELHTRLSHQLLEVGCVYQGTDIRVVDVEDCMERKVHVNHNH